MMLEIQKLLRENPNTWRDVITSDPYNLIIDEDDTRNLVSFKYNQYDSDLSNEICVQARGIVLEKETWNIVALPFFKFFNYGESQAPPINLAESDIIEKVDGSMIKLYNYEGEWIISTNGRINSTTVDVKIPSSNVSNFFEMFLDVIDDRFDEFTEGLHPENTFMFEIIHPANPIVVDYGNLKELVFIGMRNRRNPIEDYHVPSRTMSFIANEFFTNRGFPVRVPKTFGLDDLDFAKLSEFADKADEYNKSGTDFEGFIVAQVNKTVHPPIVTKRVKIKSPKYLKYHHLAGSSLYNSLIQLIQDNETEELEAYLDRLPDYVKIAYNEIIEKYNQRISKYKEAAKFYEELKAEFEKDIDDSEEVRKQIALHIKDNVDDKSLRSKIFEMVYNNKTPESLILGMHHRKFKKELNIEE